ncbi:hypothetical protein CON11_26675 [Priestia megaterium]|uniref:metallophosphoesterase n=1 Tax=Priestia megaterium TaxID=1404 RepID=UPI000BEBD248|nr:metallophosphoesterase [Priestia megaterium]PEC41740.1 hypothetical protein CON11_26675 [Priestia megaterium]
MNQRVYTIISDLHMGNHSGADDFYTSKSASKLDYLIREVTSDPEHHLVVLGDFFELWQFSLDEIFEQNAQLLDDILSLAGEGRLTYVIGNHDFEPFNEYILKKGIEQKAIGRIFGTIPMVETFEIPKIGLYAEHGHQHDPHHSMMVPTPGFEIENKISRRFVYYLKYIEKRIPDVDDRLQSIWDFAKKRNSQSAQAILNSLPKNKEEAITHYKKIEKSLLESYTPPSKSLHNNEDAWMRAAYKKMKDSQGKYRTVIMGHTHVPRWTISPNMTYINSGSWCSSKYPCSFVRADVEKESVALFKIDIDIKNKDIYTSEYHELITNNFSN